MGDPPLARGEPLTERWCASPFSSRPSQGSPPAPSRRFREARRDHRAIWLPLRRFCTSWPLSQPVKPSAPLGAVRIRFWKNLPPGIIPLFRLPRSNGTGFRRPRLRFPPPYATLSRRRLAPHQCHRGPQDAVRIRFWKNLPPGIIPLFRLPRMIGTGFRRPRLHFPPTFATLSPRQLVHWSMPHHCHRAPQNPV